RRARCDVQTKRNGHRGRHRRRGNFGCAARSRRLRRSRSRRSGVVISIIARAALSGLGQGREATGVGKIGESARIAITRDAELEKGGLARPLAARVRMDAGNEDRATVILKRVLAAVMSELDATRPNWKTERVGLALATSSGGMRSAEIFFDRFS